MPLFKHCSSLPWNKLSHRANAIVEKKKFKALLKAGICIISLLPHYHAELSQGPSPLSSAWLSFLCKIMAITETRLYDSCAFYIWLQRRISNDWGNDLAFA